jgi:hypothetical protein
LDFRRMRALGAWLVACVFVVAASFPFLSAKRAVHEKEERVRQLQAARTERNGAPGEELALSLRVAQLDGLLASWETIGGCGAGTSNGAGGGLKWIGHSVSGGLFQLQTLATYTHLSDGYNVSFNTQVSWDMGEKWNAGFSVPLLYKYYRDMFGLNPPVDVSNAGVGDVAGFLTRRFGEINATSLTLLVAAPTGVHDARFRTILLTQEKQLGLGRVNGSLTLDHTIDKTWGLIVLGGSFGYRGGQNELGNYRAPAAAVYGYSGYFSGPWVPSLGLSVSHFFGVDRDAGRPQEVQLWAVTGTLAVEWSNDSLAILGGVSLPVGWAKRGVVDGAANADKDVALQPWTAGIGITISPF